VRSGGDGELSSRIANIVFAIGNLPAETFTLTVDDIIFSDEDLGADDGGSTQSACGDGYEMFFEDDFNEPNPDFWDRGTHTFQGNLAHFRPDNISYEDGKMVLTLKEEQYQGSQYTGAELRTDNQDGFYSYGCYEVRMKSAGPSGTVSSFFAYRYDPWQEIDIEVVGKNNQSMLTNIYFNEGPEGSGNNDAYQVPPFPEPVGLSYNASEEFHNYAFEWTPGEIKWYRDGELVKQATVAGANSGEIPDLQMQIMMNLWVSNAPSFAGEVDDSNFPVRSEYEWVRFYRPVN
jgi:beta-glucanase (GH16 family)